MLPPSVIIGTLEEFYVIYFRPPEKSLIAKRNYQVSVFLDAQFTEADGLLLQITDVGFKS